MTNGDFHHIKQKQRIEISSQINKKNLAGYLKSLKTDFKLIFVW